MKLLTVNEIKNSKESELIKDTARIEASKSALRTVEMQLNDAEAKFDVTLANQRVKWAKEEEEHMKRIQELETEIKQLEKQRELLLIPIESDRKKAYDLFIEADKVLNQAVQREHEASQRNEEIEALQDLLQKKLDDVGDRDMQIAFREQQILVKEKGLAEERESIKQLSKELSINLNKL